MEKRILLNLILLFIIILLLSSCSKKSTDLILNSNTYTSSMEDIDLQSQLNLNFRINKDSLNQSFNTILDSLFINEMNVSAMGFEVDLINLQNAEIQIQGKQVLTNLPLQINLTKKTFISDIDIDASLLLTFVTGIEVDSTWEIKTETVLEDYKWLKKPGLSFGGLNIGVESLANIIIGQAKSNLEKQIDTTMMEQFKLKEQVEHMMFFLKDPLLIDSTLSKWLHFSPDSIYLSEIKNNSSFYSGNVAVIGLPEVLDSPIKSKPIKSELPHLKWIDADASNSKLKMSFDITFDKLNEYANKNFANKSLSNDGREIILNDILIEKSNNELHCSATSKGDFNGKVLIKGTPSFDHRKQALVTDNIKIDFQTNNVLHKTGLWLMKGKINNKLSSMFNFSLKDKIEDIQSTINSQVKKLNEKYTVEIKCNIDEIEFGQFIISDDKLSVFFTIDLYLESTINSLIELQKLPK